jgi:hypothetical protein
MVGDVLADRERETKARHRKLVHVKISLALAHRRIGEAVDAAGIPHYNPEDRILGKSFFAHQKAAESLLKRTEPHGYRAVFVPRMNGATPENTGRKIGKGSDLDLGNVRGVVASPREGVSISRSSAAGGVGSGCLKGQKVLRCLNQRLNNRVV